MQTELASLREEFDAVRTQLREVLKLNELMRADLDRRNDPEPPPHKPERVPPEQLQLAMARVLAESGAEASGNDDGEGDDDEDAPDDRDPPRDAGGARPARKPSKRRRLDLTKLPVQEVVLDPDEVIAAHGEGFRPMGQEVSERLAFRPGTFLRLRLVRRKWAAVETSEAASLALAHDESASEAAPEPAVVIAPVPDGVWPRVMADPSAVAHHIVSKYEDCLPLHRQEKITTRQGFCVPRGSQCGWLQEAFRYLYRIVDAMLEDARTNAFCIATDATGAPVRAKGERECARHHVFVFVADQRHVIFRHAPEHTGRTVRTWLGGFRGYLLADASSIYDVIYRQGAVVEVGCWAHLRRYFWRALLSAPERATEAIALIGRLFEIERECATMALPERTKARARRARPVLKLLDDWVSRHRGEADPRSPLHAALTYYANQREALRRFLVDGRLRLDNNVSEGQLRRLVLGRANWTYFANATGLDWYVVFRSLIASCHLHGLNPQTYLEQVLRLVPHWPQTRVLELAPDRWPQTAARLTPDQRAIVTPPWELDRVVRPREASTGEVAA